jgi:hypothetical protein
VKEEMNKLVVDYVDSTKTYVDMKVCWVEKYDFIVIGF